MLLTLIAGQVPTVAQCFATAAGSQELKDDVPPPAVALTREHYDRIARLIEKKIPVTLQFDIENRMESEDEGFVQRDGRDSRNKQERRAGDARARTWIPGPEAPGATDNAAGCAVTMEAIRILKTLNLQMPRTVRIALWTGEEEGLLGSKAYVKEHFADRETMTLKPEHAQAFRLLQSGQRHRQDPRRVPAGQRHDAADIRGMARSVQGPGRIHGDHPQHRRHRSSFLRRRRAAGFSVHSRSGGVRNAHATIRTWTSTIGCNSPI